MSEQLEPHRPTEGTLLEVYKAQWADIHHTRNQDWELSKLVLTGFVVLSGLSAFSTATNLINWLSFGFSTLSGLAILVTIRHRRLFHEKMSAIRKLESVLHVDELHLFMKQAEGFRPPPTQDVLIIMYTVSALIFLAFAFIPPSP